jgi:hypothetical protein
MNYEYAAGIDPGMKGGVVILSDPPKQFVPPLIGGKIDWKGYADIFDELSNCFVVLEEVHSIFNSSAKANFTFGGMFYSALCLLHAKSIRHQLVPPKTWQAEIWTNTDKVYKTGKKIDAKSTSLLSAKRLFPGQDFLYGDNEVRGKRTKVRDGITDAYLLAEFCRRKYL